MPLRGKHALDAGHATTCPPRHLRAWKPPWTPHPFPPLSVYLRRLPLTYSAPPETSPSPRRRARVANDPFSLRNRFHATPRPRLRRTKLLIEPRRPRRRR